jgi:glycosyltransferase involved in cell wall biosynthesis
MITALQTTVGNAAVVQMLARGQSGPAVSPGGGAADDQPQVQRSAVHDVLSRPGQPLAGPLRTEMEQRLDADFSDVRVHSDPAARQSAADLGARAYTSGRHVVLGSGGTDKHTLAHELTHVIQQRSGPVAGTDQGNGLRVSDPSDHFERAADANAARALAAPLPSRTEPAGARARQPVHAPGVAPVQRMPEEGQQSPRRNVLVVSDVSGLGLGGVPVFNMELVKGLSSIHNVTMLTTEPAKDYDHAKKTEEHAGVRIVNVPTPEGGEPRDTFDSIVRRTPDEYGLPSGGNAFDVIIGHSRFSGPGAKKIREEWYPDARLVHFLHTSPVRLDKIKKQPDKGGQKSKKEREVMRDADLVAGVGPLLTREAERLSEQILRVPAVHEFVPGTENAEAVDPSKWTAKRAKNSLLRPSAPLKLLLPGRASDEIKGVKAAIDAIGILRKPRLQGGKYGLNAQLTVRGAPDPEKSPKEYAEWRAYAKEHGRGGVTLLPFTKNPEDLKADRQETHALIMPSLHEGFGLVATEAASQAIPTLVNLESGAAQFLNIFTETLGASMSVDAPFNISDGSETKPKSGRNQKEQAKPGEERTGGAKQRARAWAAAIASLEKDLPGSHARAEELRTILGRYTWEHAAQALITAAMATAISNPDAPRQQRFGNVTRQGPDGSVEPVTAGSGPRTRQNWAPTEFWDGSTPEPSGAPLAHDDERRRHLENTLDLEVPASQEAVGALFSDIRRTLGL